MSNVLADWQTVIIKAALERPEQFSQVFENQNRAIARGQRQRWLEEIVLYGALVRGESE